MSLHRGSSLRCHSAGRITAKLLLSFLAVSTSSVASAASSPQQHHPIPLLPPFPGRPAAHSPARHEHVFSLRHVFHHGVEDQTIHKQLDVSKPGSTMWMESEDGEMEEDHRPLVIRSTPMHIQRLKDRRPAVVDPMVAAAREEGGYWALSPSAWTMDNLQGPDVTDKETVITFAQMAANSYVEAPDTGDWKDVNGGFNRTDDKGFGWDSDGLRGYLYADETNSTIVIGLKGTTLAIWDGEGTTTNDKENDNLFFSCCCGQQGSSFARQVCDCATGTYTCNITCLKKSLTKENRYYAAARYLFNNVSALYPNSNVWMSGHSLGGSLSAMIGLTYGIPVLTFQAVPDALPSSRLGLPIPPGVDPSRPGQRDFTGAYHFGHTADPIYMGTCNGATATCSYAGYALESACHSGRECVYDVVKDNGTRVSVITHRIVRVIADVLRTYESVPECKFTPECYDCPLWKEVDGNSSTTTSTTSSSTRTRSRTSTCKTPGWWGCLDETSTTSRATSSSSSLTTTSTSTSTCKTPGWFGCNDESTTTSEKSKTSPPTPTKTSKIRTSTCQTPGWFGCDDPTSSSASHSAPTSTSCETPGFFFGCHDETTMTHSHPITSPPPMPTSTQLSTTATSHSCTSREWFGLICVDPSPTSSPSSTPTNNPDGKSHCLKRSWLGFCQKWSDGMVFKEEI